jgi:hypothetical protein
MPGKRVGSDKQPGNASDANRVEQGRDNDEHHPIWPRPMAQGKFALLSDTGCVARARRGRGNEMFSSKIVRSIAAVGTGSVAAMAAVAALAAAPSANAYPANNPPACGTRLLTSSCDGPIRADGTFKRCESTLLWNGIYMQPRAICWMIDTSQPGLTNQPQHHSNS